MLQKSFAVLLGLVLGVSIFSAAGLAAQVTLPSVPAALESWYEPYDYRAFYYTSPPYPYWSTEQWGSAKIAGENYYGLSTHIFWRTLVYPDGTERTIDWYSWDGHAATSSAPIQKNNCPYGCSERVYYSDRTIPEKTVDLPAGNYVLKLYHAKLNAPTAARFPQAGPDSTIDVWDAERLRYKSEEYYYWTGGGHGYSTWLCSNAGPADYANGVSSFFEPPITWSSDDYWHTFRIYFSTPCEQLNTRYAEELKPNFTYKHDREYQSTSASHLIHYYGWFEKKTGSGIKVSTLGRVEAEAEFDVEGTLSDVHAPSFDGATSGPFEANEGSNDSNNPVPAAAAGLVLAAAGSVYFFRDSFITFADKYKKTVAGRPAEIAAQEKKNAADAAAYAKMIDDYNKSVQAQKRQRAMQWNADIAKIRAQEAAAGLSGVKRFTNNRLMLDSPRLAGSEKITSSNSSYFTSLQNNTKENNAQSWTRIEVTPKYKTVQEFREVINGCGYEVQVVFYTNGSTAVRMLWGRDNGIKVDYGMGYADEMSTPEWNALAKSAATIRMYQSVQNVLSIVAKGIRLISKNKECMIESEGSPSDNAEYIQRSYAAKFVQHADATKNIYEVPPIAKNDTE